MGSQSATRLATGNSSASRARHLAGEIEKGIRTGRLSTGTWLKQVDLESQYGASRLDVRQALDRLVEKGLVRLETNRGYRVEEFSIERFRNVVTIRAILEVAAAEQVLGNIDAAGLDRLDALAERFAQAVATGTVVEQEESNYAFHTEMLSHCPNTEMVAMIFDLRSRIPVFFAREKNTATLLAQTARDHREIVALLRERNGPALSALVRQHVLSGLKTI